MSRALLSDLFDAAPELWYAIIFVALVLLAILIYSEIKILRLVQKNYMFMGIRAVTGQLLICANHTRIALICWWLMDK